MQQIELFLTAIKCRISESNRALSFLAATNFFQDSVFTRTCDLQDPHSVFGADLYYHRECMTKYMYQYDTRAKDMVPKLTSKQLAWNQVVPELEQGLNSGKGYDLSVIRDHLNSIDALCKFRNRDVKIFLMNQFGDEINFTYPESMSKSLMVFKVSNKGASGLAEQIRSVDPVQVCASMIRDSLDQYDFGLQDRFCDAQDLKRACTNMVIPDPVLRFFGCLYNFNPETYQKVSESVLSDGSHDENQDREDENEVDSNENVPAFGNLSIPRCRKIQSLFQIMYYIHHCGRKRTPMHIMNAESIHSLGRGGKIVTTILNHEGLSLSYEELRRYQHDLASFTAKSNQNLIALPSHFDPGQFTSGAIDNWDHTVTVLFQDKPLSFTSKPKISDTQVLHGPKAFKEILPCQVLSEFHKPARHADIPTSYQVSEYIYHSEKS